MSSGNFEIGSGLSMRGFEKYVKPSLEKYHAEITDILSYSEVGKEKIFVSLIGDASSSALENTVRISLNEAHSNLEEEEKNRGNVRKEIIAWAHQVKDYEGEKFNVVGLYQDNETASKVFQNLAIEYSTKNLDYILEESKEEIRRFGKELSQF